MNYSWDSTVTPSVYVYIGGRVFRDAEVESFDINESIIGDNKLSVGNICNPTINLKLANISNDGTDNTDVLSNDLINESFLVYIKSGTGAGVNDIPLGVFRTTSVTVDTIDTTIQGEGRFSNKRFTDPYTTGLDWGQEHWVLDELVDDIDVVDNIDTSVLSPDFLLPTDSDITFEGKTVKEMLGAVASLYCANVYLNRNGIPQFKLIPAMIDSPDITLTATDLFSFTPNYNQTRITSCYVTYTELVYNQETEETEVVTGQYTYTTTEEQTMNNIQIEADIPFTIPQQVSVIGNKLLEYEYTAFQADIVGNPNYEVGDKIQITDYKGDTYTGIIFSIQHSYNGNFSQTITCTTDNTTVQNKKKTGTISGGGGVDEKEAEDIAKEEATKVADEKINSSQTAETVNAFNLDSVFESLITNIKSCLLKYDEQNEVYVYVNTAPSNYIRNYIKIFENKLQFIEAHFVESSTYSAANTELFMLGGSQVYYTSITGADAFKFLTFTSPSVLHPDDNAELYKVRLPKATNTYVKSEFKWVYNQTYQSYEPELTFGVGDQNGRGKYKFYKDGDSGRFVYTSRTDGKEYGFKITDTGVYDVFADTDYKHRIEPVFDTLNDVPADFPSDQFFFIKTIT
jgi:hypothetical protein